MDAKTPSNRPAGAGEVAMPFRSSRLFLSELDPDKTAEIVVASADLALVLEAGIVRDIAVSKRDLLEEVAGQKWRDRPWIDTVTAESRRKIEELLAETSPASRWREVNHMSDGAGDLPIKYTAVRIGPGDRMIALGRDMRDVSALQQRLVEAHQSMERDYARLRETETRYKMLFEAASEPVLIVRANSARIDDANTAACRVLGLDKDDLSEAVLTQFFERTHQRDLDQFLADAAQSGRAGPVRLTLRSGHDIGISASAVRKDRGLLLIVRLDAETSTSGDITSQRSLLSVLDKLPDGLVLVDRSQRIVASNATFKELAKLTGSQQSPGVDLRNYLGRSGTDLNVLFSTLKKHGVVRNFATVMRDYFGSEDPVEVSAVVAPYGDTEVFALSVRSVARRMSGSPKLDRKLPSSASQFTDLVGRVPLKDIVRDSTVLIEKLCIEAALEITNNNRASAAEMLGLSRQGLYSKIKRASGDE